MSRGRKQEEDRSSARPTLREMVDHLVGLTAHKFPLHHERDKNIARHLGVTAATWTRMKAGDRNVEIGKLGRLVDYFRLHEDYGLTYEIFHCPTLDEFKERLEQKGVGADNGNHVDRLRRILRNARNIRIAGISFEKIRPATRGGLGSAEEAVQNLTIFQPGDAVALRIAHRTGGHLIVLNDDPLRHITCLMPSNFAPGVAVTGAATRVPTVEGVAKAFDVSPPAGRYHLYAIWLRTKGNHQIGAIVDGAAGFPPRTLSASQIRGLGDWIERLDRATPANERSPDYEIRVTEYYVSDLVRRGGPRVDPGLRVGRPGC